MSQLDRATGCSRAQGHALLSISCTVIRSLCVLIMFLLESFVLPCATVRADVTRQRSSDGRVYFTNSHMIDIVRSATQPPGSLVSAPERTRRAQLRSLARRLAHQHAIDARLLQAVIIVESNFDPQAVSHAGAQGLMQLMPATAKRYQVDDPFDPRANIEGGVRYLKDLLQRFGGNVRQALAAYNAGEQAVIRYNGIPPFPETQQYVTRVMQLYDPAYQLYTSAKIYRYRTTRGSILFTDTPRAW